MRFRKSLLVLGITVSTLLTACGKKTTDNTFQASIDDFSAAIEKLDDKINQIDVTQTGYETRLLSNLDEVASVFAELPNLQSDDFEYYDELAEAANYYMQLSNKYYHLTFEDGFNPTFADKADRYYSSALQYVRYIGYMMNNYDVSEVALPLEQIKINSGE